MTTPAPEITVYEGSSFCISGADGDLTQGYFAGDTRVLSRWDLRLDGRPGQFLAVEHPDPFAARFVLLGPTPARRPESTLLATRDRTVDDGLRETVTLTNMSQDQLTVAVSMRFGTDLADLMAVRAPGAPPGRAVRVEARADGVQLTARPPGPAVRVVVRADVAPDAADGELRWTARIPARGRWRTTLTVHVETSDPAPQHPTAAARRLGGWRARMPQVQTGDPLLRRVLDRSITDLGALQIVDEARPDRVVVAAGAPWYMALFGRDSLLASWMALPFDAGLAVGTLGALADRQGRRVDAGSEEQPGRILHEVRSGRPDLVPGGRSTYFGTADATQLFVALAGELVRWGHLEQVAPLVGHIDRALEWITGPGDRDGDGFVEYAASTPAGLRNQGWKDSPDGVNFADGTLADAPIALAEVQAYGYAAFVARADIARAMGDSDVEARWRAAAEELRQRFDEHFWLPELGYYAVGLDASKRPIDSLTSNIGHCLWSGIARPERAASLAASLLSPEMVTGFGVRTLAATMGAYNPVSYHNGSVWPHDTAICVAGLRRYGFDEAAARIAQGLVEAAQGFDAGLPELFSGFDRAQFAGPVPYPAACMPQAWAAAAPVLLLRTVLGLQPDLPAGRVRVRPHVPAAWLPLHVRGLPLGPHHLDIDVPGGGAYTITGLAHTGVRVSG